MKSRPREARVSFLFLSSVLAALATGAQAQPNPATPATTQGGLKQVTLDLKSGSITSELPFDEPFLLTGALPTDAIELNVRYLSHERELRIRPNPDENLCKGKSTEECIERRRKCELDPNSDPDDPDRPPCFLCFEKAKRSKKVDKPDASEPPLLPWSEDTNGPDKTSSRFVEHKLKECPPWEPPKAPLTWSYRQLQWEQPANAPAPNRTFVLTIPALEAERYYSFHVSLRASSQTDPKIRTKTEAIQVKVSADLISALSRVSEYPKDDLDVFQDCLGDVAGSPQECGQLLNDLCERVKPSLGDDLAFEPGSLCDSQGRLLLGSEVQPLIRALDDSRLARLDALEERKVTQERLEDILDELHVQATPAKTNGPALAKLFASLDAAAAETAGGADSRRSQRLLDDLKTAREILESPPPGRMRVSMGFSINDADMTERPNILQGSKVSRDMVANYRAASSAFDRLEAELKEATSGFKRPFIDRLIERPSVKKLPASDRLTAKDLAEDFEKVIESTSNAKEVAFAAAESSLRLAEAIERLQASASQLATMIALEKARALFIVDGRTFGSFQTQQANYISADVGVTWAPELDKLVPTLGANIYARPVNKNVPLRIRGGFRRRFAFTFGITVKTISDGGGTSGPPPTRDDLVGSNSLLLGAGYRLSDATRLTVGALVFNARDPNPLKDDPHLSYTPFVALSFDWDVAKLFKGIFTTLGIQGIQ